jgi:hypothetical protein
MPFPKIDMEDFSKKMTEIANEKDQGIDPDPD